MEKEELITDDFLRELIRQSAPDSPSDGFVEQVMAGIAVQPEPEMVQKRWQDYLKQFFPFFLITLVLIFVLSTSDIPGFGWLSAKDLWTRQLLPSIGSWFGVLLKAFSYKYIQWGMMIGISAGLLFTIDRVLSRRIAL